MSSGAGLGAAHRCRVPLVARYSAMLGSNPGVARSLCEDFFLDCLANLCSLALYLNTKY